jgi:hypothetical protein
MSGPSLFYWQDQWGKVQPQVLRLQYNITGAKACSAIIPNSASFVFFDALSSQAQVDDVLGTTNEFLYTLWGSTAMGADAFGGVVAMNGQCESVVQMVARCYSSTGGSTLVTRQTQALAIANSLQTAVQVGSDGNLGFQVDFGNTPDFDGLTSGTIDIEIHWISK